MHDMTFKERDVAFHMHPATNPAAHENRGPLVMVKGEGPFVYDADGKQYLEMMAGLWCASLGFSNDRLRQAASRQMEKLTFYHSFAHRSNEQAIELSERLIGLAPAPMSKVMFQSSGSEANDTAIKLAWCFHASRGETKRRKVIARSRAYHGSTIAAGSLTGLSWMHAGFAMPLPGFLHVSCPDFYRDGRPGESEKEFVARLVAELEATIAREGAETIAAFFAEPVMGTGGVVLPPEGYFDAIQPVLKRHGILFVADEVICGFGRTGKWWGSQSFGLQPDLVVCAKALSAAALPISAVLVSAPVYDVIKRGMANDAVFGHGFTYGGHPVCAAVANEALRIYAEDDIIGNAAATGRYLQQRLAEFAGHPHVGNVRGIGMLGGVELVKSKEPRTFFAPEVQIGLRVSEAGLRHGLVVRPLAGNIMAFTPPLIITRAHVDIAVDKFRTALDDALSGLAAK